MIAYLSTILLSVFITVSLIPMVIRLAERYQVVDFPNPRKVHTRPIPRIGGLAMALGAVVPVALWTTASGFVRAFLAAAGILVIFGFIDDMKGLGYKAKFAGQALAALVVVFYGGVRVHSLGALLPGEALLPEWISVVITLIAVVGVTNAINLADGLDGLAGGISLLGFCCIGYLAYLTGSNSVVILSLALAGAIFGFLRFNTHPASLFMGDTGSQLLGFSAIVFSVLITQENQALSPVLPLIILGFPILDTLTVMVERVREGRSPFSPDKNHFHHRLIRLGLTHVEAVLAIYVIQSLMITAAILFRYHNEWSLVIFYMVFSLATIGAFVIADRIGFHFPRHPFMEKIVKVKLRRVQDEHWVIRISFGVLKIMVPALLLFSCLLPVRVPGYTALIAACCLTGVAAALAFSRRLLGLGLRLATYLTVPVVLYLIEQKEAAWIGEEILTFHRLSFGIVALFALLTVKFSRRKKGFRVTTMDFLVIFIAAVVPNLPDPSVRDQHLGLLAIEIIVLLFSYEVLITELRERWNGLAAFTLAALAMIVVRGVMEW